MQRSFTNVCGCLFFFFFSFGQQRQSSGGQQRDNSVDSANDSDSQSQRDPQVDEDGDSSMTENCWNAPIDELERFANTATSNPGTYDSFWEAGRQLPPPLPPPTLQNISDTTNRLPPRTPPALNPFADLPGQSRTDASMGGLLEHMSPLEPPPLEPPAVASELFDSCISPLPSAMVSFNPFFVARPSGSKKRRREDSDIDATPRLKKKRRVDDSDDGDDGLGE